MTTVKMRWVKPELIVLARGKPEEAVLQGCKFPSYNRLGPTVTNNCKVTGVPCSADTGS